MQARLREMIDYALRRLPVTASVCAERDMLAAQLREAEQARGTLAARIAKLEATTRPPSVSPVVAAPAGQALAEFLAHADAAGRRQLFEACRERGVAEFMYGECNGLRFLVNARDRYISQELFATGQFEFQKMDAAMDLLQRHRGRAGALQVLVDVGANIGSICVPAVTCGYFQRAIALEPDATNSQLLRINILLNHLSERITVVEKAASARDGERLTFELSSDNWGDHRVLLSNEPGLFGEAERKHVSVTSIKLDSLVGIDDIDHLLVWMDIQGYEGHALLGAERLIARKVPMVLEFWPYGMQRAGSFQHLIEQTSTYRGFVDLDSPGLDLRPMSALPELAGKLGEGGAHTDILVI